MRIAMIGCKGIPAASALGGGIETHVEELSTRLARRGHRVIVYVRPYANPERKTHWNGVQLITLPSVRTKNFDAITHTLLATAHVLFQKVDIIHYHGVGPSTLAWIPRVFKPRAKIVATFHGRDRFHEKWGWFARAYLAFGEWTAVLFPHATIVVSHVLQVFAKRLYGRREHLHYIPNGVDIPRVSSDTDVLASFGLRPRQYIYTLSRILPLKAIEDAIEAFAGVQTDMRLVIIGEPFFDESRYYDALKERAAKDGRVILVGRRVGRELEQLIGHAYAMVHPSRTEGLSLAILEAMARGTLVVMSDIPENRELVDHSGIAYAVGNVHALREILQWVVNDPEMVKERGARARDVVQKLYTWNSVVRQVEALYVSLARA